MDLGHSYSCHAETLYMGNGVSLDLTHNRFQAFDIKDKQFGPRKYRVMILQYLHYRSLLQATSSYAAIGLYSLAFYAQCIACPKYFIKLVYKNSKSVMAMQRSWLDQLDDFIQLALSPKAT